MVDQRQLLVAPSGASRPALIWEQREYMTNKHQLLSALVCATQTVSPLGVIYRLILVNESRFAVRSAGSTRLLLRFIIKYLLFWSRLLQSKLRVVRIALRLMVIHRRVKTSRPRGLRRSLGWLLTCIHYHFLTRCFAMTSSQLYIIIWDLSLNFFASVLSHFALCKIFR